MNERRITQHAPFLGIPPDADRGITAVDVAAASSEVAEREAAYIRALNAPTMPRPTLPRLKMAVLSDDFGERAQQLAMQIVERGIAIDRRRLESLGCERFEKLLAADHRVRECQRVFVSDLTAWPHVLHGFQLAGATVPVPQRRHRDILAGVGEDRERASKVTGFIDLWKFYETEPETVRNIYAFHDAFSSLIFGQSLHQWIDDDGRVRSQFFSRGSSEPKVCLFAQWLQVLHGQHTSVRLVRPLGALLAWLSNEGMPLPSLDDLAKDFYGVRAPTQQQTQFVAALFDGFLLGYDDWLLWEFVGRKTRTFPDHARCVAVRAQYARQWPRIAQWHHEIIQSFYRPVGGTYGGHFQFKPERYHSFVDNTTASYLEQVSLVVALAMDDQNPGTLVARFADWFLAEATPQHNALSVEKIKAKLAEAFPGATFNLEITQ